MEKPNTETIKVLLIEPGQVPRLVTIEDTLEAMHRLIGGLMGTVSPWPEDHVVIVCDDNGKLKGSPYNRAIADESGSILDIIAEPFFICGVGQDDFVSIGDEMAEKYSEKFSKPELFVETDNYLVWTKGAPAVESADMEV